jgi:DNA-binding Lrp family transcriptional regulator
MIKLDNKDLKILDTLHKECRITLTEVAKTVGLSVDSTKKRIDKMKEQKIFSQEIRIRPRTLGYPNIVDIKVRLKNFNEKKINDFISYLVS